MKEKIIVIVGPTGIGKTNLSLTLAKQYNGEIINGDALQVYKHLTIGTAKITKEEMQNVPHHLIDFLEVEETYSASDFKQLAKEKITEIISRGKLPIIVGGSGLYIEGLLYDMSFGGNDSHQIEVRKRLEEEANVNGIESLYQKLMLLDKKATEKIQKNNKRRIIRALEVIEITGDLFSKQSYQDSLYDSYVIGLNTDRDVLYQRINQRVDIMLEQGLLDECQFILNEKYHLESQSLKAIGYKELFPYLYNQDTLDNCVSKLKQNSRRYAKRQLTWFRNRMTVNWYDPFLSNTLQTIQNDIEEWLNDD